MSHPAREEKGIGIILWNKKNEISRIKLRVKCLIYLTFLIFSIIMPDLLQIDSPSTYKIQKIK